MDLRRLGGLGNWPTNPNHYSGLMLYQEYLEVLREAGGKEGYLSYLSHYLIIDTGPPAFRDASSYPKNFIKIGKGNPIELLQELSEACGGTLFFNGAASHHDGIPIQDVFLKSPEPPASGDVFYHGFDIDVWLAAGVYVEKMPKLKLS